MVNEVNPADNSLATQVVKLAKQVKTLIMQQQQHREVCGVCQEYGHGANVCPMAFKIATRDEEAIYMGAHQQRQWNDPYSNNYNP